MFSLSGCIDQVRIISCPHKETSPLEMIRLLVTSNTIYLPPVPVYP